MRGRGDIPAQRAVPINFTWGHFRVTAGLRSRRTGMIFGFLDERRVMEQRDDNPVVGWRAEVTGYGGQVTGSGQVYPGGQNRRAATLPETPKLLCNP